MNWNKFVFKTCITLSRGKAWWDGTLTDLEEYLAKILEAEYFLCRDET